MSYRIPGGVLVSGWPARTLAVALRSTLERSGLERGPMRARLEQLAADLEAEAERFAASPGGSAEVVAAEAVPGSGPIDDEAEIMGTSEAAARLGVSPRRVRQLRESGQLPGLRVGGRLAFHAADVTALVEERNHDAESA